PIGAAWLLLGRLPSQPAATVLLSATPDTASRAVVVLFFGLVTLVAMLLAVQRHVHRWGRSMLICAPIGLIYAVALTVTSERAAVAFALASGVSGGIWLVSLFVIPYAITERWSGPWPSAIAGALGSGVGYGVSLVIIGGHPVWPILPLSIGSTIAGLSLYAWLPLLLYPLEAGWSLMLLWRDERRAAGQPSLLRWHSAFWDEHQYLPLAGLDAHLVRVAERDPQAGQAAIERLSLSWQRWAARAAQIELDARRLERCADIMAIARAHRALAAGELAGPASALLRSFSRISQDVGAAEGQNSVYHQRLALGAVEERLDGLVRELTRSAERYGARFAPIAAAWRQIVAEHGRRLAAEAERRQEIDSPYVSGVPLTASQEIFVGRADVSMRIEQLLLDRRRPPLLLYGQRRMGKTSLLNNLGRLMPSTIVPLFVDLQGPVAQASDHAGLLYNLARGMASSAARQHGLMLPPLSRADLTDDPFTRFDEWLDQLELALGPAVALLMLDEFEALEHGLNDGRFSEAMVLGMLRHLIQHRPRIKLLLAGSHQLQEAHRWASYLINVQVVHLGYLHEPEARQLIERPTPDFALRYEPAAAGRVLALTRCHPFLVQLLCAEIVALKNEQPPEQRRVAIAADVEAASGAALAHGSFFFADIEHNQADAAGRALLRRLASLGQNAIVPGRALAHDDTGVEGTQAALDMIERRDLVERVGGGYRFQIELVRRWFARGAPLAVPR
ncbi:MAG: ATP-binding protein, partial [Chloroflexales bacterium]|nr:ATP-binding protein [Chloroflexales bacterium]